MKLVSIVGARPNFVKLAAICQAIDEHNINNSLGGRATTPDIEHVIIHTGQHSSDAMSGKIWQELELPQPAQNKVSHDRLIAERPALRLPQLIDICAWTLMQSGFTPTDCVLVYGDCDSTLAGALAADKLGLKLAHVEAGLRSHDRSMPEEINRILVDRLSDFLFVSEKSGIENLTAEGYVFSDEWQRAYLVGNCMIDTLVRFRQKAKKLVDSALVAHGLRSINDVRSGAPVAPYAVLTLHRPSNVDEKKTFARIMRGVAELAKRIPVLFPIHPRTFDKINDEWSEVPPEVITCPPLGYLDFLAIMMNARLVLTDSGGVQEEAAYLGLPTRTLRENTERPATLVYGFNQLCRPEEIAEKTKFIMKRYPEPCRVPMWDGKAAERIIEVLVKEFSE